MKILEIYINHIIYIYVNIIFNEIINVIFILIIFIIWVDLYIIVLRRIVVTGFYLAKVSALYRLNFVWKR